MIDIQLIEELRALPTKEGKEKLAEYAANLNITVKKTRSFDNMVADITAAIEELANEPMPENNVGLSINDLITAADTNSVDQLLVDTPLVNQIEVFENQVAPFVESVKVVDVVKSDDAPHIELAVEVKPKDVAVEIKLDDEIIQTVSATIAPASTYELPKSFSPTLALLGAGQATFATLPWWIYEWITQNPDWKSNPNSCPHYHAIDTLRSLIYYINRDGQVRIRETRNSSFQILT